MKLEPNNLINYPYYSIAWLALGGKRPFKTLTRALIVSGVLFGVEIATAQIGTAVRELPYDFHPGDLISVRIQVTPPPGTTNWLVSESYPVRWDFISVSSTNASNTNEFSSVLTFGPFSNAVPQTLSYEISSVPGLTNSESFTGRVVFNGTTNTTVGTTNLPARNEWLFAGPQSLQQGTVDGIAYGAGRWVASYRGWITTLETGGRLTYPRAPHYIPLASLAYLGGLFLLYGSGADEAGAAQMWISDDGLTWKQSQPESSDTNANPFAFQGEVRSVAYGNGVYVGVGQHRYLSETLAGQSPHGAIWRSTNGYNWRRIFVLPINTTNTTTRIIQGVAFASGHFMAVADRGTLLTSTNGSDWNELQPILTNSVWMTRNLQGICYGPAGWIIFTSVAGTCLRSTDGANWTELNGTGSPNGSFYQSFYADGKYQFSPINGQTSITDNGASWASLSPLSMPSPVGHIARAPDGVTPLYLGAGEDQTSLLSSTNGLNWTYIVSGNHVVWPRYLCAIGIGNLWVVAGQPNYYTYTGEKPTDRLNVGSGVVWVPVFGGAGSSSVLIGRAASGFWQKNPSSSKFYGDFLAISNGILAAGAMRGSLHASVLNGTNQDESASSLLSDLNRSVATIKYKGVNSQEFVNASFAKIPGGYDLFAETYSYAELKIRWGHFTSTNGTNWSRRTLGLNHATNFPAIRGLVWGAGRFVAVSEGSAPATAPATTPITTTNRIFTSTNGEDYTAVNLASTAPGQVEGLTSVAYGNGKFVATGSSGLILSSTNGLNWIVARPSDGHRWNRVRYLNGVWAAVGNGGWVAFSLDGQMWTSKTAGAEADLTDIAYQNGQYMMVGSHAMVLISLPVTPPQILSATLLRSLNTGTQFTATGQIGKIMLIQASDDLANWSTLLTTTNLTGTVLFSDPQTSKMQQFYRAAQLP